ncbi:Dihydrofolate synthase/folylpolyglutamate synthase [Nymphon striatum]|nr:Dihydrofolate synthase/folylpolyglutamate synthase [Nymphon striatum]
MKRNLQDWLSWQETLHLSEIDLGLERIGRVAKQLDLLKPAFPIITIAGTNGKGSSVAFFNEILQAEGYKTGAYTSPHLINYNERITINGAQASDELIVQAFEAIDKARFITNESNEIEEVILEVGLGGRLDAANLWDTSLAVITSIDIDHIDWLGDDREIIAKEKSGIMRDSVPVISGDPNPPKMIKAESIRNNAPLFQLNEDFNFGNHETDSKKWVWKNSDLELVLPKPKMQDVLPVSTESIEVGLKRASVTGRLQIINESPEWLLDVAHNPHSAKELAKYIDNHQVTGKTFALFSMLSDKDITEEIILIMDNAMVKRGIGAVVLAIIAALLLGYLLKDKSQERQEVVDMKLPGAPEINIPSLSEATSKVTDTAATLVGEAKDKVADAGSAVVASATGTLKTATDSVKSVSDKAKSAVVDNSTAATTETTAPQNDTVVASTEAKPVKKAFKPTIEEEPKAKKPAKKKVVAKAPKKVAKKPAPAKPAPSTSSNSVGGKYSIQLLATSSQSRANKLASTMNGEGYVAFITQTTSNNKILYRVRVGGHNDRSSAIKAQDSMKRRYKKNFFVQNSLVVSK